MQCREHLMNVVIPREDGSSKVFFIKISRQLVSHYCVKGDDHSHESKKHKSRDLSLKKVNLLLINNILSYSLWFEVLILILTISVKRS